MGSIIVIRILLRSRILPESLKGYIAGVKERSAQIRKGTQAKKSTKPGDWLARSLKLVGCPEFI
jgi:hypothetical protein